MFDTLIRTKLYLPASRPDWLDRSRLLAQLELRPQTRLVLVSAPAGYGKTTLITAWLESIRAAGQAQVCWLTLDPDDSDPGQFFRYLARAVEPLPGAGASLLELLETNQSFPVKTLMGAFIADVTSVSMPFILTLDDYHTLNSAEIDVGLALLLDHMPPQMTLAITSRHNPGFPISRLRARDELIELRADDLRFSHEEAAHFLAESMGLPLGAEQIAALEARTEGWIAGLQMAALSMQGRSGDDLTDFVQGFTGSHRFIMDYLTDEVLAGLPGHVGDFLLQNAVLHHLNADLCDAVLGATGSQAILEELESTNTFLISLDDERRWYRYHNLFADLLRQKVPAETARAIRMKAAHWSAQNGLLTDAIEYAIAAEDWQTAVPMLIEHGLPLLFQGRLAALRRWHDALPPDLLWGQPRLCINYAWVLVNQGHSDSVEPYLIGAETAAEGAPRIRAVTALIRANIARSVEDLKTARDEALITLELAAPDNLLSYSAALLQLGAVQMMTADLDTALDTLTKASVMARQVRNFNVALLLGGYLGLIHLLRADLPAASAALAEAQSYAAAQGLDQSPLRAYQHLGLAHLAYLDSDREAARQHIEQTRRYAGFSNELSALCRADLLRALVELEAGDRDAAEAALGAAEQTAAMLKNPALPALFPFIRDMLNQTSLSGATLEAARLLILGAPLPEAAQPLADPLSERELEILRLIAAGLKNQQIADELYISLNTVLYHTKNIYGKLGVNKRTLAINRAGELGLL